MKNCLSTVWIYLLGSAVGVIIPDSIPDEERTKFENILKDLTAFHVQVSVLLSVIHSSVETLTKLKMKYSSRL